MDVLGGLCDTLAFKPDVAGIDQALGEGAAFQQPDEEKVPIEAH